MERLPCQKNRCMHQFICNIPIPQKDTSQQCNSAFPKKAQIGTWCVLARATKWWTKREQWSQMHRAQPTLGTNGGWTPAAAATLRSACHPAIVKSASASPLSALSSHCFHVSFRACPEDPPPSPSADMTGCTRKSRGWVLTARSKAVPQGRWAPLELNPIVRVSAWSSNAASPSIRDCELTDELHTLWVPHSLTSAPSAALPHPVCRNAFARILKRP
jgi:hypothetical protein